MRLIHRKTCFLMILILALTSLSGCSVITEDTTVDTKTAILQTISDVQSVESYITLEMKAHIGSQGETSAHTASIGSDITIQMTAKPLAVYAEYYSRIMVDGVTSRDDKKYYIVEEGQDLGKYLYVEKEDEWEHTILTKAEAMAVPAQTGLIYDWVSFLSYLNDENYTESVEGKTCSRFSGQVPASILQELFGNNVFGTFVYSTEMLLSDLIPCVLYIDSTTYQPVQVKLTFHDSFIVTDMIIDSAIVTVTYSKWNEIPSIEVPKQVEIIATNPNVEFYSTYYAWNLFLPYIHGGEENQQSQGNHDKLSFLAQWDTFQVRIDGSMTKLPIPCSGLEKAGYSLDSTYGSTIIEPNQYIDKVPMRKGADILYCTVYNADTVPQPISSCSIGAIDLSVTNNANSGIQVYLPGEVTLGITKEALISAYGEPNKLETSFAYDTYIWNGESENHCFLAEISAINNQVIRIQIKCIPVSGGPQ